VTVTVAWLMERPTTLTEEEFEHWYLDIHAAVARRMPRLRRYNVARLVAEPNPWADSTTFRIAQLYWDSVEDCTTDFNTMEGFATFGDGTVHTKGAAYVTAMALTNDVALPVRSPAVFDVVAGGFRGNGTIVKVMAYGRSRDGDGALIDAYATKFGDLGEDSSVRAHVVGSADPGRIRPGHLVVPGPDDRVHDWSLELWFDDAEAAEAFLASERFGEARALLEGGSTDFFLGVFPAQELFVSVPARPHPA
jgi:uncharacterized protein (TIGR02118 family)